MDRSFRGRAKRLDDIDLPRLGRRLGVGEDHLHMFLDCETTGSGFLANGEIKKLFERHKFYAELEGQPAKLQKAIKAGLANKRPGGYGKESEQRAKIIRAMDIDETAALRATSWGIGQVMGFNHKAAGYPTVQAMVTAFMDDEEAQLEGAVNFILANHLDDELRRCKPGNPDSCRPFAKGYNGSNYQINRYHEKMADSLLKWSRIKDTPYDPANDVPAPQKPQESRPPVSAPAQEQEPVSKPVDTVRGQGSAIALVIGAIVAGVGAAWAAFGEWVAEVIRWPWF